jgi:uncharacterized protein YjbI with pentapeptide repeats
MTKEEMIQKIKEGKAKELNLYGANLEGANLKSANLEGAYLYGANLYGANLEGAILEGANLNGAYLEGAILNGANLKSANLKSANLNGANLEGAILYGANLEGANLEGAFLEGAFLEGANLKGAFLEGAILYCTNLNGANLEGANLEGANLEGANLEGANLEGANLEGANLPEKSDNLYIIAEKKKRENSSNFSIVEKKDDVKNMSKKTSMIERNRVAMNEAAYGIAATKIQDFAQQGLMEVAKEIFTNEEERKVAEKILGHDFMKALIGLGVGNAAHYIPGIEDKAQAEKLANKTMEIAYMRAGVFCIDGLIEKFAPNAMGIIGQMNKVVESLPKIPAETNLRIGAVSNDDGIDVSFKDEENLSSSKAKVLS